MPDMAQPLHTPLCRELGIEYPIFCAGIGTAAGPDLAAAVSDAGGFGVVGASSCLAEAMPALIAQVRERTTRPFGVNFIIDERDSSDEDRAITRQQVSAAIAAQVAAGLLFWGDPAPYVEEAHRHGVRIIIQVGSVDEARAAAASGVDAVIAQGVEAGGHVRGTTSIWKLLPAVVEAIKPLPVLASGGIGDGTGLARAIRLGAQGVSLGTRFVSASSRARRARRSSTSCTTSGGPTRRTERCAIRRSSSGRRRAALRPAGVPAKERRSARSVWVQVRSWSGRAMRSVPHPQTSTATSNTRRSGRGSPAASSMTSSPPATSSETWRGKRTRCWRRPAGRGKTDFRSRTGTSSAVG